MDSNYHQNQSVWPFFWVAVGLVIICLPFRRLVVSRVELAELRQQVLKRVESAGGWTELKRDCDSLANRYTDGFRWLHSDTNSSPAAIAALKPKEVAYYSPSDLKLFGIEGVRWCGSNAVVRISVFGSHSTGGHDQRPLGLDVVCERALESYRPERLRSTIPLKYWNYRRVAEVIYEYY